MAGAASLALGLACKDSTGPTAGTVRVQLAGPPANGGADGAIKLVLDGPTPTSVTPAPGLALWSGALTGTTDTLVLTVPLPAGTILTLAVTDNRPSRYSAQILQVAAGGTFQLRALTGYALTVVK